QRLVERRQQPGAQRDEVAGVRVPAAQADGYEARAGLDESPGRQHALAERPPPVGFAHRVLFLFQVEGLAGLVRAEDVQRLLLKAVWAGGHGRLVRGVDPGGDAVAQLLAAGELLDGKAVRQGDPLQADLAALRAALDFKRVARGPEKAGAAREPAGPRRVE